MTTRILSFLLTGHKFAIKGVWKSLLTWPSNWSGILLYWAKRVFVGKGRKAFSFSDQLRTFSTNPTFFLLPGLDCLFLNSAQRPSDFSLCQSHRRGVWFFELLAIDSSSQSFLFQFMPEIPRLTFNYFLSPNPAPLTSQTSLA